MDRYFPEDKTGDEFDPLYPNKLPVNPLTVKNGEVAIVDLNDPELLGQILLEAKSSRISDFWKKGNSLHDFRKMRNHMAFRRGDITATQMTKNLERINNHRDVYKQVFSLMPSNPPGNNPRHIGEVKLRSGDSGEVYKIYEQNMEDLLADYVDLVDGQPLVRYGRSEPEHFVPSGIMAQMNQGIEDGFSQVAANDDYGEAGAYPLQWIPPDFR